MNITIFQLFFLRSGTEEQYGETEQLLDDISAFLDDMHKTTTTKKKEEELDRTSAEMFRDAAMVSMRESRS
jgi:hypothetical protein